MKQFCTTINLLQITYIMMVLEKSLPYTHVPMHLCSVLSNIYFHKIQVYHLTDLKNQSLQYKEETGLPFSKYCGFSKHWTNCTVPQKLS